MNLIPVFVGHAREDGQGVVLYREDNTHFLIKIGDGPVEPVTPGSEFVIVDDINSQKLTLQMQSREWTGSAEGNKALLLAEQLRDL